MSTRSKSKVAKRTKAGKAKADSQLAEAKQARARLRKLLSALDGWIGHAEEHGTGGCVEDIGHAVAAANIAWARWCRVDDQSATAVARRAARLLEIGHRFYRHPNVGVPKDSPLWVETDEQALAAAVDHVVHLTAGDPGGLGRIPPADWADAIGRWPDTIGRGGDRNRGSGKDVLYRLLSSNYLSNASSARNLWETLAGAERRAQRPSRAK